LLIGEIRLYLSGFDEVITISNNPTISMDQSEIQALRQINNSKYINNINNSLYVSIPYLANSNPDEERDYKFILAANIDNATLKNLLSNIISYESAEAAFCSADGSWSVSSKRPSDASAKLQSLVLGKNLTVADDAAQVSYLDVEGCSYIVVYKYSHILNSVLMIYALSDDVFEPLKVYNLIFWSVSALSFLIIITFCFWLYRIIHKPLKELVKAFHRVEGGELNFHIEHERRDEFGYLYKRFNNMLDRLKVLIHEVYEQQIRSQQSELKRLQSQIDPHFLYNNFFVLSRLIYSAEPDQASQFASYLGQYFQFVTRDAQQNIKLEKEVQHARTFTDIQYVCYTGRILVDFEQLPEKFAELLVPRLILQPVIENCYKYAFENKLTDARINVNFLEIKLNDTESLLKIVIEDNGDLSDEKLISLQQMIDSPNSNLSESTGLYNVHRRIFLMFGQDSGLKILRSHLGGMRVEIHIKLQVKILRKSSEIGLDYSDTPS
ncbi:MAG: histidine kinase, partial [Clostridiaceae bacterium]|nr:histidine kinase [Clostridiaceae bacterium]